MKARMGVREGRKENEGTREKEKDTISKKTYRRAYIRHYKSGKVNQSSHRTGHSRSSIFFGTHTGLYKRYRMVNGLEAVAER